MQVLNQQFRIENLLSTRVIVLLSLLLSLWLVAIDPVINTDAILYLRTAEAYLAGGFSESFALFDRPILPVAMAMVHQLTGLSLVHAGQLIISLFYLLLCLSFVAIVRHLGGNSRVQLFALLVILCHPMVNNYRSAIMRDPGFWVLSLLSLLELLRYNRKPVLKHQLRWLLYSALAILFRFEAILFVLLAPLGLLVSMNLQLSHRFTALVKLWLPALVLITTFLVIVKLWFNLPLADIFPHIALYSDELTGIAAQLQQLSVTAGESLLRLSAREDALYATVAGLAGIFLLNVLRATLFPFVILLILGWWQRACVKITRGDNRLIMTYALISAAYLLVFTLANQFMLERYCTLLVIFLLIYSPFILEHYWGKTYKSHGSWVKGSIVLLLALSALDSVHNSDYKKAYIVQASNWIQHNTDTGASLLSNDKHIAYFSRRQVNWQIKQNKSLDEILTSGLWKHHQYLAIKTRERHFTDIDALISYPQLQLIQFIRSEDRGSVAILRNSTYPPH